MNSSRSPLDPKRWFDRMQPQTLQIATWLLYLNGLFLFIDITDMSDVLGYYRWRYGALGVLIGIVTVLGHVGGAWLMANDRRLGWRIAVAAAFAPFVLRIIGYSGAGLVDRITGGSTINALFEAALCALLLHPHSRQHQRVWYR